MAGENRRGEHVSNVVEATILLKRLRFGQKLKLTANKRDLRGWVSFLFLLSKMEHLDYNLKTK